MGKPVGKISKRDRMKVEANATKKVVRRAKSYLMDDDDYMPDMTEEEIREADAAYERYKEWADFIYWHTNY